MPGRPGALPRRLFGTFLSVQKGTAGCGARSPTWLASFGRTERPPRQPLFILFSYYADRIKNLPGLPAARENGDKIYRITGAPELLPPATARRNQRPRRRGDAAPGADGAQDVGQFPVVETDAGHVRSAQPAVGVKIDPVLVVRKRQLLLDEEDKVRAEGHRKEGRRHSITASSAKGARPWSATGKTPPGQRPPGPEGTACPGPPVLPAGPPAPPCQGGGPPPQGLHVPHRHALVRLDALAVRISVTDISYILRQGLEQGDVRQAQPRSHLLTALSVHTAAPQLLLGHAVLFPKLDQKRARIFHCRLCSFLPSRIPPLPQV